MKNILQTFIGNKKQHFLNWKIKPMIIAHNNITNKIDIFSVYFFLFLFFRFLRIFIRIHVFFLQFGENTLSLFVYVTIIAAMGNTKKCENTVKTKVPRNKSNFFISTYPIRMIFILLNFFFFFFIEMR